MPPDRPASAPVLALRGAVKCYGPVRALDGVDLEVFAGEVLALVGPSGCGKTSALKLLNGLLTPDAGRVEVDGVPLASLDLVTHRRATGYVIQGVGLLPHWSVERNVETVLLLNGAPRAARAARVQELLEAVGLSPKIAERRPAELSGGERQRVGIARALAARPRVLLMDEPFGALDPLTRVSLRRLVRSIQRRERLSVVLVTHDLEDARVLADRVGVMNHGKLVETLPARELENAEDEWVREFVAPGAGGSGA